MDLSVSSDSLKCDDDPWELTEYERQRKPHEAITDDTEITISARSLDSELKCPICLDMLRNTMTAKECLHRFCQECITTALRSANKECPTCRKKLVSKRSLRPDPNFDALIAKIYPNREEYDAMQKSSFDRFYKTTSNISLQRSIEQGMRDQAQSRKKFRNRQPKTSAASLNEYNVEEDSSSSQIPPKAKKQSRESSLEPSASEASSCNDFNRSTSSSREVEIILYPCASTETPRLPSDVLQNRFLKTSVDATVEHLAKYLATRMKIDAQEWLASNSRARQCPSKSSGGSLDSPISGPPPIIDSKSVECQGLSEEDKDILLSITEGKFRFFVGPSLSPNAEALSGAKTLECILDTQWKHKGPLVLLFKYVQDDESQSSVAPTSHSLQAKE